jgi:hypothetical protein
LKSDWVNSDRVKAIMNRFLLWFVILTNVATSYAGFFTFKSVTWYLTTVNISNIPSFDLGTNGDADNTLSDPFVTTSTGFSGPIQFNTAAYTGCALRPSCLFLISSIDNAQFDTFPVQVNLFDHSTGVADQLITTFTLNPGAGTACRNFCLNSGFNFGAGNPCMCPITNVSNVVNGNVVNFSFNSVMVLTFDYLTLVQSVLAITGAVCILLPVAEKLKFPNENNTWRRVSEDAVILYLGGLPTALLSIIVGLLGRVVFGDTEFGNYQLYMIRVHIAPRDKLEELGARPEFSWRDARNKPLFILWAFLASLYVLLQVVITFVFFISVACTLLGMHHYQILKSLFRLKKTQQKAAPAFLGVQSQAQLLEESFTADASYRSEVPLQTNAEVGKQYQTAPSAPTSFNKRVNF